MKKHLWEVRMEEVITGGWKGIDGLNMTGRDILI